MAITYEPITTTTLGSATNTITFSSISSAYTDLRISAVISLASDRISLGFNSDVPFGTSNYDFTYYEGNGGSVSTVNRTNWNGIEPASNWSASYPAFITFDIFSYNSSAYKTVLATASTNQITSGVIRNTVGVWRSTSAINSITIKSVTGNMSAGSIVTLYGIKSA